MLDSVGAEHNILKRRERQLVLAAQSLHNLHGVGRSYQTNILYGRAEDPEDFQVISRCSFEEAVEFVDKNEDPVSDLGFLQ